MQRTLFFIITLLIFNSSALAQSDILYGEDNYNKSLQELKKNCDAAPPIATPTNYGTDFCTALFFMRENIKPLNDISQVTQSLPVILLGDVHPNTSIKEWLGQNMKRLKDLGFTHFAMEALNSNRQELINQYRNDSTLRPSVVQLFTTEWGWKPEEHTQLVDDAFKAGLDVLALDNREEPVVVGSKTNSIAVRNEHMTAQILNVLKKNPQARIAVLSGQLHVRTSSTIANVKTIPELLTQLQIENKTYNLDSGEELVANVYGKVYVADGLDDFFVLPTPRSEALIDGIIYTKRAVVLGNDMRTEQIPEWTKIARHNGECRYLEDIPGTFVCLTNDRKQLKKMMGRMSYLVEGKDHIVAALDDHNYNISKQARYVGHDIWGADFINFFKAIDKECSLKKKNFCANSYESGLNEIVTSEVKKRNLKEFVVLAVAKSSDPVENLSHELKHAKYFLSKEYQIQVNDFWMNQVSTQDQQNIKDILGKTYDISGEKGYWLLLNEFQAYLLEDSAKTEKLQAFVDKYSDNLKNHLSNY